MQMMLGTRITSFSGAGFIVTIKKKLQHIVVQWKLDLRKPDLRKNLALRMIVATTDFV